MQGRQRQRGIGAGVFAHGETLTLTEDGLVIRRERLRYTGRFAARPHHWRTKDTWGWPRPRRCCDLRYGSQGWMRKLKVACQLETHGVPEPIKSTEMPEEVWDMLSIDFFGPLPNGSELMVILDEGSRNPVVCEVKKTASDSVVPDG
jgi:hypothetical protein